MNPARPAADRKLLQMLGGACPLCGTENSLGIWRCRWTKANGEWIGFQDRKLCDAGDCPYDAQGKITENKRGVGNDERRR